MARFKQQSRVNPIRVVGAVQKKPATHSGARTKRPHRYVPARAPALLGVVHVVPVVSQTGALSLNEIFEALPPEDNSTTGGQLSLQEVFDALPPGDNFDLTRLSAALPQ